MKKIFFIIVPVLFFFGCSKTLAPQPTKAYKLDINQECNPKKHTVDELLTTATTYNKIAKQNGVEFQFSGISTTKLIQQIQEAKKQNKKNLTLKNSNTLYTYTLSQGSQKACIFAIRALQQQHETKSNWKNWVIKQDTDY